jgi:cytidylate kinase
MSKNVVETYVEFNNQLIILISGLSGSGKSELGKNISRDFKMKTVNTKKFYKSDFKETIKLPNEKIVINYDTDDAIDWDMFNKEINENKKNGIVGISAVFPTDKLDFNTDYHIHLKISKQELKKKRTEYIERHKDKNFDLESELLRVNIATYPYYLNSLKRMKIDKFIDVTEMSDDEIYDAIFDAIIKFIEKDIYSEKYVHKKDTKKEKKPIHDFPSNTTEDYIVSYQVNEDD